MRLKQLLCLILGPFLFASVYLVPPFSELSIPMKGTLATTLWVAFWWISEVIPIGATSLLPLVLIPLSKVADAKVAAAAYGDPIVFMYMGGFILAISVEKWSLHSRVALNILKLVGSNFRRIVLGFMLATAFISMWISNTATALLMLPIGAALVSQIKETQHTSEKNFMNFGLCIMLGIGYTSSIGGLATLTGSAPNLVFASMVKSFFDVSVDYNKWMFFALPLSIILLIITYLIMVYVLFPVENPKKGMGDHAFVKEELQKLGAMTKAEKYVICVGVLTALSWMFRKEFLEKWIPGISDSIISIIAGISLFIIPANKEKALLEWVDMKKLPWSIILLFGGGLCIAGAFKDSGLGDLITQQLTHIKTRNPLLIVGLLTTLVLFLTEIMSNTATSNIVIPLSVSIAAGLGIHPYILMAATALASSCAFMLPVSTPPNAIVFSSGYIKVKDMVRLGFIINIFSIIIITLFVYYLMPMILDFNPNETPKIVK